MSPRTLLAAVAVLALLPMAACSPTIAKPHLLHPGPANVQRYNAEQFDPYPQNDMGPKIVGGRPIDYMVPVPQVERANQYRQGERPINLATPGTAVTIPVAAPVYVPAPPQTTLPAYPAYPPTLPATSANPSPPPSTVRY